MGVEATSLPAGTKNKRVTTLLSFHAVSIIAAIVCFVLAVIWLFVPEILLRLWGVAYSQPVGVVSRRGAALFLCVGIMLFLVRNAEPSPSRNAIAAGFVVGCLTLASLGVFELVKKRVNVAILSAVIVELMLAIAFMFQM